MFRRLGGWGRVGESLEVNSVAKIFKRVAEFVGMEPKDVAQVSGHSVRVGATQDLLALNIDLASVMQAGRWKSNRMPMKNGERQTRSARVAWGGRRRSKDDEESGLEPERPRLSENNADAIRENVLAAPNASSANPTDNSISIRIA